MMFEFSAPLFWYKMIFMAELLAAWYVYTNRLKRRELFIPRAFGGVVVAEAAAFLFPIFGYNAWFTSMMFFCLFAVTLPVIKFCYDEPWLNILFCGIAAYTTQHLAYEVYSFLLTATGFDLGVAMGMYGYVLQPNFNIFTFIFYGDSYIIFYLLCYFVFARRINRYENLRVDNVSFLLLAAAIVIVNILLNAVVVYHSDAVYDKTYLVIAHIYNVLCCIFAISIQFGLLSRKRLRRELDTVNRLLHEGQEQYTLAKENIDLINRKCHDLKHQIRLIARNELVKEKTITEIEQAISIYGSVIKTENESLDVILTEKSLRCSKHNIKLSCIADGKSMSFMDDADIYTLLGNAIDNAVDAVINLENPEKRFIRLKIQAAGRILTVHLENWFEGKLTFRDDLPVTTKSSDGFHGYGMKSMRMICNKYEGDMAVNIRGNLFMLDIMIPFPPEKTEEFKTDV